MKKGTYLLLGLIILALASLTMAAPIRVGIFKGVVSGRYWHTSTHPGSDAIAAMLANPAGTGFPDLVIPSRGFSVKMYGVSDTCATTGCTPSTDQKQAFIDALDTLDVAIFLNNISFGGVISNPMHREKLSSFWMTKGLISMHSSTDNYGDWAPWDTLNGARFYNHPSGDRTGTLHLDTLGSANRLPSWRLLNRGLPDTARFFDEWFSFSTSGATIRSKVFLIPTVNIDENSYEGGLGGAKAMGDHPMSWYREFPGGGRFFHTALAHRIQTYDSVYFFRRQLYNAILWASKDTTGQGVSIHPAEQSSPRSPIKTWVSGNRIHVQVAEANSKVELYSLDGTRLLALDSKAPGTVSLNRPLQSGTFIVCIRNAHGIQSTLVAL